MHDLRITTNTVILTIVSIQIIAVGLLADLVVQVTRPADVDGDVDAT